MITRISIRRMLCMMIAVVGSFQFANCQNSNDAKEVTSTYYIKNAFVVQKPGVVLPNHSIIIEDGMIKSVGANLSVPFDAEIINADSMYVYAGFIDACSHAGVAKKEESNDRPRVNNPGNPPKKLAGITPQYDVRSAIGDKLDKSMSDLRELGFGFVHVVPRGRMLPGQGSVLSTGKIPVLESIIKENVSQFAQFKSARRMFPGTTIGVMSQFRDLIKNATYSNQYEKSYSLNPKGLERPKHDEVLSALYPVVDKEMPVFFYAPKVKDVNRALILQEELGYKMILTGVRQGWPLLSSIISSRNPIVLSLNLPEEIKDKKDEPEDKKGAKNEMDSKEGKDKKDDKSIKKEDEKKKDDPEMILLKEKKKKSHDEYVGQAALFEKQNVNFSLSTLDTKSKNIRENILRMVKGGLSENGALAALTTNPASLLGISSMAGSVEQGKIANVFITDKPYFDEKSKIKYVIIDGEVKKNKEEKKKKKKVGGESIDIEGTWSYEVAIPGDSQSGSLVIEGSGDDLTVSADSSDEPGDFIDGANVNFNSGALSFDLTIDGMTYNISLDFEEEAFDGTLSVGEFGTFPMTGSKQPE